MLNDEEEAKGCCTLEWNMEPVDPFRIIQGLCGTSGVGVVVAQKVSRRPPFKREDSEPDKISSWKLLSVALS